ncbi:MAG TPA: carboxypeptidase regulatory-like domain-containing protein [Gemmatimonadaceae bacterium]|jgi:hypothetical protein|nr:carboxypeptidase regulatory-like domain-containing protein [Gemmatimonadaceae bacterium]
MQSRLLLRAAVTAVTAVFSRALAAQVPGNVAVAVAVVVRVADSANVAVADADVSIVQGLSGTLAHATTNANGRISLTIPRVDGTLQLSVRRIGFVRGYRFFSVGADDTLHFEMQLARAPQALETVKVTAAEDLKRKSYYLTADDIENSSRAMIDATDIFKLRPDMMTSRGGAKACEVPWTDRNGWIESVWVNGVRVVLPVVDSVYVAGRRPSLGISSPPPRPNPRITRLPAAPPPKPAFTQFGHIDSVLSILATIKPEHIAEITYHDCFDQSIGKNHSDMAMFIVLKPGIGFENGRGSYVIADQPAHASADALQVGNLPRYRFRVLGVFDTRTGDPLPGVDVIELAGGNRAKTTATGTLALFFIPDGENTLRLHHDGFRDTTVTVNISPADTVPLTFLLNRQP